MKVGWILTGQREIGCRPERFDVGREGLGGEACAKNISAGESRYSLRPIQTTDSVM
jgi:hypothetical protein